MAKSQLFKPPMDFVFSHGGVFPVMRGKSDDEAFATARGDPRARRHGAALRRGRALARLLPEGRQARPGHLALTSGAPVVPIAIYGSQFMRDYKRHGMPKVVVRYGRADLRRRSPSRTQQQSRPPARSSAASRTCGTNSTPSTSRKWRRNERANRRSCRATCARPTSRSTAVVAARAAPRASGSWPGITSALGVICM